MVADDQRAGAQPARQPRAHAKQLQEIMIALEQQRCWRLTKQGNHYRGTAEDIVGEARGEVQGNALNWRYTLQVPVNGKVWDIALDDWLYLIDENNLIDRTKMKKWGLPVGELTLHIRKLSDAESAATAVSAIPGCVIEPPV